MKAFLLALVTFIGLSFPALAAEDEISIQIKGMVCSFCGQGLTKKLSDQPEVAKVDVNLENKTVRLNLKQGASLNDEKLKTLIEDAGYNVTKIER